MILYLARSPTEDDVRGGDLVLNAGEFERLQKLYAQLQGR